LYSSFSAPQTANWKATPAWKVIKAVSDMTPVPGLLANDIHRENFAAYIPTQPYPAIEDDAQKKASKTGTFQISGDVIQQLKAE
jgi:hypothetical protein